MVRSIPVVCAAALASCAPSEPMAPVAPLADLAEPAPSNLLRGDYAGSAECALCHPDIHATWQGSPMRSMTRDAGRAHIRAPARGGVEIAGDVAFMERVGDARVVTIRLRDGDERRYRVTRVIGGRVREDFVGVEVTGAADPSTAAGVGEELVLPLSYVFSNQQWRYKGYSVLVRARDRIAPGTVWRQTCILCHNTAPYLVHVYDELLGDRRGGYQGSMANDALPPERRWRVEVTDAARLRRELGRELERLGAEPASDDLGQLLAQAIDTTRERWSADDLIETGIGCEACHNGARAHADDPDRRPSFAVTGPVNETWGPQGHTSGRAEQINRMCMRCHTVLFSRYAHTWEGGHRYRDPGGSPVNSGEARDFWLGGCATRLACTACHDPHAKDDRARLDALAGPEGNRLCAGCHPTLAEPDALAAHSHHDPTGPGSACVSCHMPRKNLALDYELTRYHRIGSPTDRARVEGDRPIECGLCHPQHSAETLVSTIERWWGKRYDRDRLRRLYGDLDAPIMEATLRRGKPHEQAVAVTVLGETATAERARLIAPLLRHRYPLVRHYTARALERLLGAWPEVDLDAPTAEIRRQTQRWLDRVESSPAPGTRR